MKFWLVLALATVEMQARTILLHELSGSETPGGAPGAGLVYGCDG
jgi:hypothetical protein